MVIDDATGTNSSSLGGNVAAAIQLLISEASKLPVAPRGGRLVYIVAGTAVAVIQTYGY